MNNIYFLFLFDMSSNSLVIEKPKRMKNKFQKCRKAIYEQVQKQNLQPMESIDIIVDETKLNCNAFRSNEDLLVCVFYNPSNIKSYVIRQMIKEVLKKVDSFMKNYGVII